MGGSDLLWASLVAAIALSGCANADTPLGTTGTSAADAADVGPPMHDLNPCSGIENPPCLEALYNPQTKGCDIVPVADGTSCNDGAYCTVGEVCNAGHCVGGLPLDCTNGDPCKLSVCDEAAKKCEAAPLPEGAACESPSTDLCKASATCHLGQCNPIYRDCSLAPGTDDCNVGTCDPATGQCKVGPGNEGTECTPPNAGACAGSYDATPVCVEGVCQGGLDLCNRPCDGAMTNCGSPAPECSRGSCNPADGTCAFQTLSPGDICVDDYATVHDCTAHAGFCCQTSTCVASVGCVLAPSPSGHTCPVFNEQCNAGACDGAGTCDVTTINQGAACNDYDLCTVGETCQSGSCTGGQTAPGTTIYLKEDFNGALPNTWKLDPCGWLVLHGEQSYPISGTGHDLVVGGGFLSYGQSVPTCPSGYSSWHYATTPAIDVSKVDGSVYLTFFHFWDLGNDIYGGPKSEIAVDIYDGAVWQRVLDEQELVGEVGLNEQSWHTEILDVTSFKSAAFTVRFGYTTALTGGFADGIDDVRVASAPCAPGTVTVGN